MIVVMFLSMIIQNMLQSRFEKYSRVRTNSGMTGAEIARKMLADHGITDVKVTCIPGRLTDHYNPQTKTVNLSESVYNESSVAAAAVALGVAIAAIVGSMGGSKKNVSHGGSSGGGGSSGSMGSVDITTGTGSLEDAINANTKALEKTNSALADMIRQAGSLVLSDNMRLGSTVAASGTAQVVSAANSYHREGDTINQYIQSKAQTAADLARETRWEADKAKARKR